MAEAAKVIENTQRDLNIAFMNELSAIFELLGIDTGDVLAAAAHQMEFPAFQPGLVGGHCIGVDPYYLTHRAEKAGYHPQVILAGRRINDGMGERVARECVRRCSAQRHVRIATVTVLGLTFKENVPGHPQFQGRSTSCASCRSCRHRRAGARSAGRSPDEAEHEYGIALTPLDGAEAC